MIIWLVPHPLALEILVSEMGEGRGGKEGITRFGVPARLPALGWRFPAILILQQHKEAGDAELLPRFLQGVCPGWRVTRGAQAAAWLTVENYWFCILSVDGARLAQGNM